jgi:hypothetical protein
MVNRTPTADLLKGIAALLMIQVHIIELFATHDIFKSNLGQLLLFLGGPPVAPVFMIIFGYFIAGSKKSTFQLVLRGAKIITLGILLNLALNFNLILSVNKGLLEIDILPYIFGVDILSLAGLSIITIAILKKALDKGFVLIIPFIIISAFLGNFLLEYTTEQPFSKYVLSLFYGASWWSYFPLFPWLAYSLTGILFYKIQQNYDLNLLNNPKIKIILGASFLLFLTLTIQYAITISSNLPTYYHHGLIFFLWVISFLFFYSFFINEIDKVFGATILFVYLKWLGKNITIVYIIQWIIIGNIATEIYKTVSDPLYLLLWFASVLLISSGICYSWIKIKEILTKQAISN